MITKHHLLLLALSCLFVRKAFAVTLISSQTNYVTSSDITTDSHGITSSFSGTSSSLRQIANFHVITTGNNGAFSGAYGIRSSGDYNKITNSSGASIITTGNSGRGISISDYSEVYNQGSINTQGTTSYGIYLGGDSNIVQNSGSISTTNTTAYAIYLNGDSNSVTNSGSISTKVYGVYGSGNENQIFNSGTITTSSSSSAHGIYVSAASSSTANSSSYNEVENSGTITSSGNGIYVKDNYTRIINSGNITSASTSSIYGVRNEGDNVTITNSGTINSQTYAIYNSGSSVVINNSGSLNANVFLGDATFNILGGSLKKVEGNASSSILNIGSDSLAVTFNQSSDFSGLISLNIKEGSILNSYSSIDSENITISDNAILNLEEGSSLNAAILGSSSSSGTLNISGFDFSINSIGNSSNKIDNLNINSGGALSARQDLYVANLNVNDGTLNLDETDDLTIFGNLSGGGNGVINLGANSQTVDGDFNLTNGDVLSVTLGKEVGKLMVLGDVNIDQNATLKINTSSNSSYIVSGSSFEIINTTSGTLSSFSSNNISINGSSSNSYGLLTYSTQTNANSVTITINRLESSKVTSNQNAANIYENINQIGANSSHELQSFQVALDNSEVSIEKRTAILNQVSPSLTKAMISNNNNLVNNSFRSFENRLDKIRSNNLENGFWIESFGSNLNQKEIKDDEGYKINSVGLSIGFDKELENNNTFGISFNHGISQIYSESKLKQNSVSSYQITLYNSQNWQDYFFDSLFSVILNQYDATKSIQLVDEKSEASFFGKAYAAKIKGGKIIQLNNQWSFIPEIALNFVQTNIDGYSEKNAGSLNLIVNKIKSNFLESRVAANFSYSAKFRQFPEFSKISLNCG
ncbi:MAG: autotransporter domain-containing protein, partial [Pelagibacterales bacterium]|nr:autotransporter domain-containing protein [Pelagibacterales bacterium]